MTKLSIPAFALLPLRIFFGVTFLWAGFDKLLDPTFFDPTAPTSIHAQLVDFARQSPLGDLVRATLPAATPIGLLIAVGELGIGIGTVSGLAFRVAALGGAALSLLFWLTASWATHPYYFGSDLPYAFGWLTLALAGHGNLLVPARWRERETTATGSATTPRGPGPEGSTRARRIPSKSPPRPVSAASWAASRAPVRGTRRAAGPDLPESTERRLLLQAGLLTAVAAVVASITAPLRAMGIASEPTAAPSASPTPAAAGASGPIPTPVAAASGTPGPAVGDLAVARVTDVDRAGSVAFTIPFDAPAPLPAGDPGIVVKLGSGDFVAYDAVCTHAGCTVEYDAVDAVLLCPCHGAAFDPAHDAAVLEGPTRQPLTKLPLHIDPATGTISLVTS